MLDKILFLILILSFSFGCKQNDEIVSHNDPINPTFNCCGNPADCYCLFLGYEVHNEKDSLGEYGVTILPNGVKVHTWAFYRGYVFPEYNYCAIRGYKTKVDTVDHGTFTTVCATCIKMNSENHIIEKIDMNTLMLRNGDTICHQK